MQVLQLISDTLRPLFDAVDQSFNEFDPLCKLASLIKARPAHIALSFFVLGVIALGVGLLAGIFVTLFGMVYPAYMTFKVRMRLSRLWVGKMAS